LDAQQQKYNTNSKKIRDLNMLAFQFKKLRDLHAQKE